MARTRTYTVALHSWLQEWMFVWSYETTRESRCTESVEKLFILTEYYSLKKTDFIIIDYLTIDYITERSTMITYSAK